MELIYYTIAALVLYGISDYILNSIEIKMGKRLPNRSFIFLIIITILSIVSFSLVRAIFAPLEPAQQTTNTQIKQSDKKAGSPVTTQVQPTMDKTKK